MDNKINLSQLAERLAQEGGMSKAAAEQFVKNFFDIISQRVLEEGLVKVKGLGTFKLIQMEDRESVNVNTGERFTIDGHQKISFVPDADLKERINKPFAAFDTVVITEEQAAQLAGMDTETESAQTEKPAADTDKKEESKPIAKAKAKSAKAKTSAQEVGEPKVKEVTQTKGTRCLLKIILWIVITILVIGLALFMLWPVIGNNVLEVLERNWLERNKTEMVADSVQTVAPIQEAVPVQEITPQEPAAKPAAQPAAQPAAKPAETPAAKPAVQSAGKYPIVQLNSRDQAKDLSEFTMDDVVNFSMEGQLATHTLAKGETITLVALKYYGSKKLWPYIVKYNNIKDPTRINAGTVIKVPVLKAK